MKSVFKQIITLLLIVVSAFFLNYYIHIDPSNEQLDIEMFVLLQNRMEHKYQSGLNWCLAIVEKQSYKTNKEVEILAGLVLDPRLGKHLHAPLISLCTLPWEEIFTDLFLTDKFEVILDKRSFLWNFQNEMPHYPFVATSFENWTTEHMRMFIFMNCIDPRALESICLNYLRITPVQYDYIVNTESFIKASELFLQNNLEVIAKAKEFYTKHNSVKLSQFWMLQFQGIPMEICRFFIK